MEDDLRVVEEDGGEAEEDEVVAELGQEAEQGGGDRATAATTNCPLETDNNNK